jgi:hypothetical protein
VELGISPEATALMSPEFTDLLLKAYNRKQRREDRRTARICWAAFVSSGSKRKDGQKWSVDDFALGEPMSAETREKLVQARLVVLQGRMKAQMKATKQDKTK